MVNNIKNLEMYCISLEPKHLSFIKKLGYTPVGLGDKNFNQEWVKDNTGNNISKKNKNYGEYTFHYWIWKNYLEQINHEWVGFCQYRKFWTLKNYDNQKLSIQEIPNIVLKEIPDDFKNYDVIMGEPYYINQRKIMKFLKKGLKIIIKNPKVLIDESSRNIRFHFDLMHGENNLYKAVNLLDHENKNDFWDYVNTKNYFHPHNMFICKNSFLKKYYEVIFPWLERCESIFGFENLRGYDLTRIYGFLAERFLSYWFSKNAKLKTMNITFYDINDDFK